MSPRAEPVITARVGPLELDVPRTAGYYGGVGLAVALGLIEWPVAIFIAGIPLVKLLQQRGLPRRVQFAVHIFDGAAKPVGGDAEGTVRLRRTPAGLRRAAAAVAGEPAAGASRRPASRRRSTTASRRRTAAARRTPSAATGESSPAQT